jgi:hypothetical protein
LNFRLHESANLGFDFVNAIRNGLMRSSWRAPVYLVRRLTQPPLQLREMKSAYELAMERLEKAAPSVTLTEDQKKQIAEIDSTFLAKIAEKELFLKDQIRKAQTGGKFDEAESLEKQLAIETRRLQEDCEAKKEKLRASFAK